MRRPSTQRRSTGRRDFLKQGATALAAVATTASASATSASDAAQAQTASAAVQPPPQVTAHTVHTVDRVGADLMVDVIKSLGFEYVCANPGSSFRGLHESLINYGHNTTPELLTCCHEESSVAMAQGYAKIEDRPLAVLAHGTVGLQHASMALYNAWCDHAPVYVICGNTLDATARRPGVEWLHSVQDAGALVRDFVKWDDVPRSLPHFTESAVRAYKIAMTPPRGPVLIVCDSELQETSLDGEPPIPIPRLTLASPPQAEAGAIADLAKRLVGAEQPVLVADRAARTPAGLARLIELAELLQAAVVDQSGRLNFPSRHPLNQSSRARAAIAAADLIVGLELTDFWGTVNAMRDGLEKSTRRIAAAGAALVSVSTRDLSLKANYQDFQRYPEVDLAIAADAETTLAPLIEAVRSLITGDRRRVFEARGKALGEASRAALARAATEAGYAWNASPISTARMSAEIWQAVQHEDWSLVSYLNPVSQWPMRLWNFEKHYQFIGGSGGSGIGYTAPGAVGAALANRRHGRLSVNIQTDGDLMYAPGVLWTAAHHRIPLLSVMHNNRAYHQETMHIQRMANRHNRGVDRATIGTLLDDPPIDFAKLAQSLGVYAEGPIVNPHDLGPALARAIAVVKKGEPALLDVVTQPR